MKSLFVSYRTWMTCGRLIAGLAMIQLWATDAAAQRVNAQVPITVQLPTFHFFTVDTTVLVPDGGDALLGGLSNSAAGRTEQGIPGLPSRPFTNTAIGSSTGASSVSVSAQIHDFEAMDQTLLAEAAAAGIADGTFHSSLTPSQLAATQLAPAQRGANTLQSVAALRAQNAAEDAAREQAAAAALEHGRQLQADGKPGVAKFYFQTAAKQSAPGGDIHRQALAALAAIEQAKAAAKVAGQ